MLRGAVSKAEGMAYIDTGSNGTRARRDDPVVLLDTDTDLLVDDDLEALLISRASDCEASAKVASVSSLEPANVTPLPLRAPRFLRLLVEVDLDSMPSK